MPQKKMITPVIPPASPGPPSLAARAVGSMPKLVSFVVLVAIILLIGGLLVNVLAPFLLPMFLAVLLTVIFRPLQTWLVEKCRGRDRIAAILTTLVILLIVLLPLGLIIFQAAREGVILANKIDQKATYAQIGDMTTRLRTWTGELGIKIPSDEELASTVIKTVQSYLTPAVVGGLQFVGSLLIGFVIMIISLYYFLADGPGMIATIMRLSPLDDKYEQQLLQQFDHMSRAVLIATLLSAVVQGILAGIAFFAVGFDLAFLLIALTMALALVPFVGAAAVWVPCSLYLFFVEQRILAAILFTLYCGLVVSTSDNLIKPMVLSGRSNLHPLLALLSVLGGVAALGPIGIFVGPMLVGFLQALLNMLRSELDEMSVEKT